MWWRSAVNCPFFLRLAASRTRSSAWVTRARLWVRCVLCWSAFPLVPGLGSTGSAAGRPALFVGFAATLPESDFSGSCIGGYGSSPSHHGPRDPIGPMADPEISRFPRKERPYMPDPMGVEGDRRSGRVRLQPHTLETAMHVVAHKPEAPGVIRSDLGAIFVSLELRRLTWLITSLSACAGEKMSKHSVAAGDIGALLARFSEFKQKAFARTGKSFPIIVIQEAGLDGFWIHRVLQSEGIESHVVDPASIATSRRRRRAKTDRIDGEALLRALLAYKRGEPRVCSMVRAPTPEDEDRRRLSRERKALTAERVKHVNRVKGLLFSQGVSGYEPLRRDRRQRLDELKTGGGRPLPPHLKAQIIPKVIAADRREPSRAFRWR